MPIDNRIEALISRMTLAEKVGQVFVFTWKNQAQARNDLRLHPGGYIRIYSDALTVGKQTREIQQLSEIPLIIAADFERGIGGTIGGAIEIVTAMALGATCDEDAAFEAGRMIGLEARAMGINMNYAPVLDVNSNRQNPVINTRSFGASPRHVARMGVAFARGLQNAGVLACGKHFPGHGNTNIDSHSQLGTIHGDRDELNRVEFLPFREAIIAGVDAIMSAHLIVPSLEPENVPATLSKRIMTDILRTELGFDGVAVTDALEMAAVADNYPPEKAIPMALNAGCDQLIMPQNSNQAVDILLASVKRGEVSEHRLNEAVGRVLTMKQKGGILDAPLPDLELLPRHVLVPDHIHKSLEIAERSIAIISNDGIIPLAADKRVVCIPVDHQRDSRAAFLEPHSFADYLASGGWKVDVQEGLVSQDLATGAPLNTQLAQAVESADIIVLALYVRVQLQSGTIDLAGPLQEAIKQIFDKSKPVILVSFGSPYVVTKFEKAAARLCAFSATQASQQAMAKALKGLIQCTATSPVDLQ